jgi:hypothetical protein
MKDSILLRLEQKVGKGLGLEQYSDWKCKEIRSHIGNKVIDLIPVGYMFSSEFIYEYMCIGVVILRLIGRWEFTAYNAVTGREKRWESDFCEDGGVEHFDFALDRFLEAVGPTIERWKAAEDRRLDE